MKKLISGILACSMLLCTPVAFAEEVKEVVIDTEVPEFENLEDGKTYAKGKVVSIADLSEVRYAVMKKDSGKTVSFDGKEFKGYTELKSSSGNSTLSCINYTDIYTADEVGSYMVYACDIYNHDIAVRFTITAAGEKPSSGGGGGGGGGGSGETVVVKQPHIKGDTENIKGTVKPGVRIELECDTESAKIYYTLDGKTPTSKSNMYAPNTNIVLKDGQTLKAVAIKLGKASEVSEWKCEAEQQQPDTPDTPSTPGNTGAGQSIVKDVLEADDHIVYMNGYVDGTFKPDNDMTRSEVAAMFARLMKDKMQDDVTYESTFSDVDPEAWYSNYVGYIQKHGIITGYEDGTFRPEATITRAEFVTMASRFAELTDEYECTFDDVDKEYWAYEYIAFAACNGWINGYTDNTFRADDTITRAEVVTIVNNMLGRNADREYVSKNVASIKAFGDVDASHWAYYDIVEATNEHDYTVSAGNEIWN